MAGSGGPIASRRRGGIRRHGDGWQARVSAGSDPSTGERIVLYETVPIPEARTRAAQERAEREAYKEAEKVLTRLQAEADALKVGRTKATVGALLERWMVQHEIDATTRMTYDAQIRLYIVPKLGDVPLMLFVREAAERLEPWYAQLRRCPRAVQWSSVHRETRRGRRARLCRCRLQAARLQALRSIERALDQRHPVRRMLRGCAMGMDQLQPDAVSPAAGEAAAAAEATDE